MLKPARLLAVKPPQNHLKARAGATKAILTAIDPCHIAEPKPGSSGRIACKRESFR